MTPQSVLPPEELKSIWEEFIRDRVLPKEKIRPIIYESWKRCENYGVNPKQVEVLDIISLQRLEQKQKKNEELISIAKPVMERIYKFVTGSGFIVSIADKDGYILDIIGDVDIAESAMRGKFVVGANWSEKSAGTNAIGTALAIKEPLQVFASEHYCVCSHKWTCSGAPIINPSNQEVLGILSMTGRYENVHCHTLGMVFAAVHAIENELSLRNAWLHCEIANNQKTKIIDSITEGIMAVDQNNQVSQLNKICCQLLGIRETRALYQDIFHVVGPKNRPLVNTIIQDSEVTDQQLAVYNVFSQKTFQCTVSTRSIVSDNNEYLGKVVLLSEFKRARKLVQKMLGNQAHFTFDHFIGKSTELHKSIETAKTASDSSSNVFLLGESGTGKEMFAQAIHNASSRHDGPFLAINCSGIPRDLIGSELFGYAEGAFTGAKKGGNPGKFELADGGTLFLDEIGDMPMELQAILLRVLEEKEVMRIGSGDTIPVDVRIIAATNKNIWDKVKEGTFRDDLFYRLNVLTINMVPLRNRREDILELTNYFIKKYSNLQNKSIKDINSNVIDSLEEYDWPGNVRQLENVVERMVSLAKEDTLSIELVPDEIKTGFSIAPSKSPNSLQDNEKKIILDLLHKQNNNLSQVARELNIARSTLYRKIRKYNIQTG